MATVGALVAKLSLHSAGFTKGMSSAGGTARRFGQTISQVGAQVKRFAGLLITAAGGAGLAVMVRQSMTTLDAVGKMAKVLGMATEDLMTFHHAADLAGSSAEKMNKGLITMVKNIGEASMEYSEATDALEALEERGLVPLKELARMNPADQFLALADAISKIENASERAAITSDIFSKRQIELLNVMTMGSKGLLKMKEELRAMGVLLNQWQIQKVEDANDAITRMRLAVRGLYNSLAVALAPILEKVADFIVSSVMAWNKLEDSTKRLIVGVIAFSGTLAVLIPTLASLATAIGILVVAWKSYSIAAAIAQAVSGPAGWITLAIGLGAAALAAWGLTEAWKFLASEMEKAEGLRDSLAGQQKLISQQLELRQARESWENWIDSLEMRVKTFGMDALSAEIAKQMAKLPEAGRTPDFEYRIDRAVTALRRLQQEKELADKLDQERNAKMRTFTSLIEASLTPAEKLRNTMADLTSLLAVGAISQREFQRAVAQAEKQAKGAAGPARIQAPMLARTGTREAYELMVRSQGQQRQDNATVTELKGVNSRLERQTEIQRETNEMLDRIEDLLSPETEFNP